MRPRQKTREQMEQEVRNFNERFPVGTPVKLRMDNGELKDTSVRGEAFILSGHTVVAFFYGISGAYLAERAFT